MITCTCVRDNQTEREFAAVRSGCEILRSVLLPDPVWRQLEASRAVAEGAPRQSVLQLAYSNGTLPSITRPLHDHLESAVRCGKVLSGQYREDLKETWILGKADADQLRQLKMWWGRISEFMLASHIVSRGHSIANMEAFGAAHDIESIDPPGTVTEWEVKFIGDCPELSGITQGRLANSTAGWSYSAAGMANYMLLRVLEAARQLRNSANRQGVAIVVAPLQWFVLRDPLCNAWIKWDAPRFLAADRSWSCALDRWCRSSGVSHVDEELMTLVPRLATIEVLQLGEALEICPVWGRAAKDA